MTGKTPERRRVLNALLALALVAQAFLGVQHGALVAYASEPAAQDGLRVIVICTGSGYKRITLDEEGNPVGEEQAPANPTGPSVCHVCAGMAGCASALSAVAIDLPKPPFAPRSLAVAKRDAVQERFSLRPASRGPPAAS
jgi:hypothetical protein